MDSKTQTRNIIKREKGVETDLVPMKNEETDTSDIMNPFIQVKGKKINNVTKQINRRGILIFK